MILIKKCVIFMSFPFLMSLFPSNHQIVPLVVDHTSTSLLYNNSWSSNWNVVSNECSAARFNIEFPSTASFHEEDLFSKITGTIRFREYFTDGNVRYSLSYVDLPSFVVKFGKDRILNGAFDDYCKYHGPTGKINSQRKDRNNQSTLDYRFQVDSNSYIGKFILVDNSLLKVEVSIPDKELRDHSDDIRRFFSSCNLSKKYST